MCLAGHCQRPLVDKLVKHFSAVLKINFCLSVTHFLVTYISCMYMQIFLINQQILSAMPMYQYNLFTLIIAAETINSVNPLRHYTHTQHVLKVAKKKLA